MAVRIGGLGGAQALVAHMLGLMLLFVGERLVGGESGTRMLISGLGLAGLLGSCLVYLLAWLGSSDEARRVERLLFSLSLLSLGAVGVYVLGSDWVQPKVSLGAASEGVGPRQILSVLWPIMLCSALVPLVFVQWSLASMGRGRGVELGRVRASFRASATLAVFLCTLFLVNAVATRKDVHTDLSYFRTTSPSEASRELVANTEQPLEVLLVFPKSNEVLAEVEPYFKDLGAGLDKIGYRQVDLALEPELADKYRVGKDGTVLLLLGAAHQKIDLGLELDRAKARLSKLDQEFQTAVMKLLYTREVIYLVTGHGERGYSRVEGDLRPRISKLKRGLEQANYTLKRLEATGGLAQAVPEDAAALLWIGPRSPLLPGEQDALTTYLDGGGRLLLLLDPEFEEQPTAILKHLGLRFDRTLLAHDRFYMPSTPRKAADRYNLVTNKFSNHAAATTVSRFSRDLPVILPSTGSLARGKNPPKLMRTTFLLRSLNNTWADAGADLQQGAEEGAKVFQLAAAVSRQVATKAAEPEVADPHGVSKPAPKKEPEREMRVAVFADADLFSDDAFKYEGNRVLLADVLRWLLEADRMPGPASSEEDVPVVHSRSEDTIWFYSTVFAVPLLILGIGFFTRWGRGRKRRAAP